MRVLCNVTRTTGSRILVLIHMMLVAGSDSESDSERRVLFLLKNSGIRDMLWVLEEGYIHTISIERE